MHAQKNVFFAMIAAIVLALFALPLGGCGAEDIYDNDYKIIHDSTTFKKMFTQTTNGNVYTASADSFSGVETIKNNVTVTDGAIRVSYGITVDSGRFKIVATDGEKLYLVHEGNGEETDAAVEAPNGTYSIRIVGDNAKFSCTVSF